MKIFAQVQNGKIGFTEYTGEVFRKWMLNNPGARLEISSVLPESHNLRKFYHGACLPLWCYLDGGEYRNHDLLEQYHEVAKIEFCPLFVRIGGKSHKIGQTSRGHLKTLVEAIIGYLEGNYGIDTSKVLNPDHYKEFMETIYMDGKYDSYIEYLVELRLLENKKIINVPVWHQPLKGESTPTSK